MAIQQISQQPVYAQRQSRLDLWMNKVGNFVLEYWAHMITTILGVLVLLALSVPVLTYLGLNNIAKPIFYSLHLICAQIPSHSFYILGHQLGMCARNMAIYGSMFAGGLIFILSKKRLRGIPWWFWLLLILPMAYDGITQMLGLRESTWELRVITGTLFGLANMWFVLPFIQKTIRETIQVATPVQLATPSIQPISALPVQHTAFASNPTTPALALDTTHTYELPHTPANVPELIKIAEEEGGKDVSSR